MRKFPATPSRMLSVAPRAARVGVRVAAFFCLLGLGVSSAPGSRAWAEEIPQVRTAVAQVKERALALLENHEYEEAYGMFMRLIREEPEDGEIVFGLARSAQGAKRYAQALLAYERLVDANPTHVGLRFELAKVLLALGDTESARIEQNTIRQYDPTLTEEAVEKAVQALARRASPWRISGSVSTGVVYDTNINQGVKSNIVTLGPYEDLFIGGIRERESPGVFASGTVDGGYRLGAESSWWLVGDVSFYQRWNVADDLPSNNEITWGRAAVGGRYVGEQIIFDLRAKGEGVTQVHRDMQDQTVMTGGGEALFGWGVIPSLQLITRASVENRDYSAGGQRNGVYWSAGQFIRILQGDANHELLVGARLLGGEASFSDYSYNGWEGSGRVVVHFPLRIDFSPSVQYKEEIYRGPATAFEDKDRVDKQWRFGAMLSWSFLEDMSLDTGYQYVATDSTSGLYEFDQHITTLGLNWRF